ncbi:MAG: hypothetical protein K2Z81_02200 [Cyanobacteria bacterium]|nr:hypothetical protein [Cyanobacteriota bacterium]
MLFIMALSSQLNHQEKKAGELFRRVSMDKARLDAPMMAAFKLGYANFLEGEGKKSEANSIIEKTRKIQMVPGARLYLKNTLVFYSKLFGKFDRPLDSARFMDYSKFFADVQ